MVEGALFARNTGVDSRPSGDRAASRSLEAGLAALFCIFVLFATLGPWFNLVVAYGLGVAAMVAGTLGLVWAHAASHRLRRRASRAGARVAGLGALASIIALSVSAYFVGLLTLVLNPLVLTIVIALLLLFLVLHFGPSPIEGASV